MNTEREKFERWWESEGYMLGLNKENLRYVWNSALSAAPAPSNSWDHHGTIDGLFLETALSAKDVKALCEFIGGVRATPPEVEPVGIVSSKPYCGRQLTYVDLNENRKYLKDGGKVYASPPSPKTDGVESAVGIVDRTVFRDGKSGPAIWIGNSIPDGTRLYTSPPSPKAEWSDTGEPLNLRAAAEDAVDAFSDLSGSCLYDRLQANLRKFLGGS